MENFPAGLRHKRLKSARIPARFFLASQKIFSPIHALRLLVQLLIASEMYCGKGEKSGEQDDLWCGKAAQVKPRGGPRLFAMDNITTDSLASAAPNCVSGENGVTKAAIRCRANRRDTRRRDPNAGP